MDSGIMPDSGNADTPDTGSDEIEVPLSMLAIEGNNPSVGDTCDFAIEARVTNINGDMAMVTPEKVNGQPIDKGADTGADDASAPQFDSSGGYMPQ